MVSAMPMGDDEPDRTRTRQSAPGREGTIPQLIQPTPRSTRSVKREVRSAPSGSRSRAVRSRTSAGSHGRGNSELTRDRAQITLPTPSNSGNSTSSTSASPAYDAASPELYNEQNSKPLIVKLSLGGASVSVLPPTAIADSSSPRAKRIRKSSRAVLEEQEMRLEAREAEARLAAAARRPNRRVKRESPSTRAESVLSDQASTIGAERDEDFGGALVIKRRKSSGASQKLNTTCHHDKVRLFNCGWRSLARG